MLTQKRVPIQTSILGYHYLEKIWATLLFSSIFDLVLLFYPPEPIFASELILSCAQSILILAACISILCKVLLENPKYFQSFKLKQNKHKLLTKINLLILFLFFLIILIFSDSEFKITSIAVVIISISIFSIGFKLKSLLQNSILPPRNLFIRWEFLHLRLLVVCFIEMISARIYIAISALLFIQHILIREISIWHITFGLILLIISKPKMYTFFHNCPTCCNFKSNALVNIKTCPACLNKKFYKYCLISIS